MRQWWESLTDKTRYGLTVVGFAAFITFGSEVLGRIVWSG